MPENPPQAADYERLVILDSYIERDGLFSCIRCWATVREPFLDAHIKWHVALAAALTDGYGAAE